MRSEFNYTPDTKMFRLVSDDYRLLHVLTRTSEWELEQLELERKTTARSEEHTSELQSRI